MTSMFAYRELNRKSLVRNLRDAELCAANYSPAMSDDGLFLGVQLKKWRKARGLTLEQLADDLDTSKGYLSEMERNKRPLNSNWLAKIASAYKVQVSEIIGLPLEEDDDSDLTDMIALVRKLKRQGKLDRVESYLRFLEAEAAGLPALGGEADAAGKPK